MNKNKVDSNDIIERATTRICDALRPHNKKIENKQNNGYFWIIRFGLLILYVILILIIFSLVKDFGVFVIYSFGKSLRSVLSFIWICVINLLTAIVTTCLLYDNFKKLKESTYYKNLYKRNEVLLRKKEDIFGVMDAILKAFGIVLLVITGGLAIFFIFSFIYLLILLINGMYIISPLVILLSIFSLSYFAFKNIEHKFFNTKGVFGKTHFIVAFIILIVGVIFFGYEISSFEYKSTLPYGFDLITKEKTFELADNQKIKIKSDTKLDNLKVYVDNNLENEIKIKVEYYDTAQVKYLYNFNENDDLDLTFTSDLDFNIEDSIDVLKLFIYSFNNKTMYNYNLFKYPNIYVYVNGSDLTRITVE